VFLLEIFLFAFEDLNQPRKISKRIKG
jgi:hypothetical protein